MGVPQNRRFITEHPMKMDDLVVTLFQETSTYTKISPIDWLMLGAMQLLGNGSSKNPQCWHVGTFRPVELREKNSVKMT